MDFENEKELQVLLKDKGEYGKTTLSNYDFYEILNNKKICCTLDLYCSNCKTDKTFVREDQNSTRWFGECEACNALNVTLMCGNLIHLLYQCPTCHKKLYYSLLKQGNEIIKISQYPSLYEVSRDELKKYKKNDLIDAESFNQIYKADICASSGYFVAAYTYMRRVYETLMISVFKQNETEIDISEEDFKKLGGHEKIKKIRAYLAIDDDIYGPMYSMLSGGVHTYTEDECSSNYEFLKYVLLDILAEQKAKKERESNRKEILDLFSKIKSKGK